MHEEEFEVPLEAILAEFKRIGLAAGHVPVLVLPSSVTRADFLARLRAIPDGAGGKAFDSMMAALPWTPLPLSHAYPDAGDRFSHAEYMSAYRFINASPKHLADRHVKKPRRGPEAVTLALLSHVSPELEARVNAFREEVRRERLAAGIDPALLDEVDQHFARSRDEFASTVAEFREH
jgi:hypothetical protein